MDVSSFQAQHRNNFPGARKIYRRCSMKTRKMGARIGRNGEPGLGSGSVKQQREDRGAGAI
jgi:hypothetical protein